MLSCSEVIEISDLGNSLDLFRVNYIFIHYIAVTVINLNNGRFHVSTVNNIFYPGVSFFNIKKNNIQGRLMIEE